MIKMINILVISLFYSFASAFYKDGVPYIRVYKLHQKPSLLVNLTSEEDKPEFCIDDSDTFNRHVNADYVSFKGCMAW